MRERLSGIIAIIMTLVLLLSAVSFAEELGEVDLYAPEIYEGEAALETPLDEPEQALEPDAQTVAEEASATTDAIKEEAPATVEIIEENSLAGEPVEYAVAAPALEPMAVTQTVALTGKKASAQMNVGDSLQITVNEGETGKFASKTKKLATVDANGLVTALKKGKAKITFKPTKGKTRTLTIKIVDPYEPTGISISQGKTVTVNLGDSLQLGAVLSPGTARTTLTWSSSKKKNVSVNASGTVTALKEGSAKITVKTANKKKATITIKVVDPYKPTGVSITQGKSATLNAGETLQLSAVLSPATAQSGLTWKSSKSKVATVDASGLVTAVGKGTATITVTTRNGKKATCKVTIKEYESSIERKELNGYINLISNEGERAYCNYRRYDMISYGDSYLQDIRELDDMIFYAYQTAFGDLQSVIQDVDAYPHYDRIYMKGRYVQFYSAVTGGGYLLSKDAPYSLFGFYPGMTLKEAQANAKKRSDIKKLNTKFSNEKYYGLVDGRATTTMKTYSGAEISVILLHNQTTGIVERVGLEVFIGN